MTDQDMIILIRKNMVVKVYSKIETSPWAFTLTEPVTEAFELLLLIGQKIFFLANQRREAAG